MSSRSRGELGFGLSLRLVGGSLLQHLREFTKIVKDFTIATGMSMVPGEIEALMGLVMEFNFTLSQGVFHELIVEVRLLCLVGIISLVKLALVQYTIFRK